MDKRRLGKSDLMVSELGLGCNTFGDKIGQAEVTAVVEAALDQGINFFDTADCYSTGKSEELLGAALGKRRGEAIVATKFGLSMPGGAGGSRAWVKQAAEDSLKRLGTDRIDLFQIHRPDPKTPIAETLGALDELVKEGKIRFSGCSGFSAAQIAEAEAAADQAGIAHFVSAQDDYSLAARGVEAEILPACEKYGWGFLPYFPLASGLLTGKYRRGAPVPEGAKLGGAHPRPWHPQLSEANLDMVEKFATYAESRGHTLLDLAFGWLLANPLIPSVIAGATRPDQVKANVAAGKWRLSAEEVKAVRALF